MIKICCKLEKLLKVIEKHRKDKRYLLMECQITALRTKIAQLKTPEEYAVSARIFYEQHMAEYQLAMDAIEMDSRIKHLERSLEFAEKSVAEAEHVGDEVGRLDLDPRINKSEFILPQLGRWSEAWTDSVYVCNKAEARAIWANDPDQRECFWNIAMKTYLHRLTMQIVYFKNTDSVRKLLESLTTKPFYRTNNQPEAIAAIKEAQDFLDAQ